MKRTDKRSRRILALVLVLVLGTAAWTLWTLGRKSAQGTAHAETTAALDRSTRPSTESVVESAEREKQIGEALARPKAASAAATAASEVRAAAISGEVEVLVVRHGSGEPVPNAELLVWVRPTQADKTDVHALIRRSKLESELEEQCVLITCDGEGRARAPKPVHDGVLIARTSEQWGTANFDDQSESPVRVETHPDSSILVDVVDLAGAPVAGAWVTLRSRFNQWSWDNLLALTEPETGRAVLRHSGSLLWDQNGARAASRVGLAAALSEPVEVEIDPKALPTEPLRLVMPATGEVEVELVRADGAPFEDVVDIDLRVVKPGEENAELDDVRRGPQGTVLNDHRGSRALFPHVEPGTNLLVCVTRQSSAAHTVRGRGPAAAGQRSTLTVRIGDDVAIVGGRALDDNGVPLVGARLNARVQVGENANETLDWNWNKETDALGRFELDVHPRSREGQARTLVIEHVDKRNVNLSTASRPLPNEMRVGAHELGDVTFAPAKRIASGRVVDGENRPVQGASIQISYKHSYGDEPDAYWWQNAWNINARSGADGKFDVRGSMPGEELALSAAKEGLAGEAQIVSLGATNVELRLLQTGEIAGTVLVDKTVSSGSVRVQASIEGLNDGSDHGLRDNADSTTSDEGKFTLRNLTPNTYTVTVRSGSSWTPLATIEGVLVESRKTTRDVRLDPLDLRGAVMGFTLTIVDVEGKPVPQGYALIRDPNMPAEEHGRFEWFQNGKLTVTHGGSGVEVRIAVQGFCAQRLENVISDQTITLRRSPSVRLVLRDFKPLPEPYYLVAEIKPKGDAQFFGGWHGGEARFDERGEIVLQSSALGLASVTFDVQFQQSENSFSSTEVDLGDDTPTIEVLDVPGEQRFELTIDLAKVQAAVEQMQKLEADQAEASDE